MSYLKTFLIRIVYLLGFYTLSRFFLFANNLDSFSTVSVFDFFEGVRFDISALFYINIPLLILLLFPTNFRRINGYKQFLNILFYAVNIPFIILNNLDIEYFRFTQKRSTIDFFQFIQLGEDAKNIIPQYLKDYWPITLFTIIQVWLLLKIKYIPKTTISINTKGILNSIIVFVIGVGIFIVGVRGGFQLKPIKPINAGEIFSSQNTALILNTPFCIFHSFGTQQLSKKIYFSNDDINSIYSPLHHFKDKIFQKKNVILLIMESLSREFVGSYNNGNGYTPFLDSLMQHSLVFENAFASGMKSIEGLPAITASIPMLMENPLITSSYAQNNFESLASLLAKEDYKTSFYHGGFRGTMGFDSFCRKAGFQKYVGLEEYDNLSDYDGSWGIYDEEFFRFYANYLQKEKEPFFSTFFSVTLHPPFVIPDRYKNKFTQEKDAHKVVAYSDYAMQTFFEKVKNEDWFKNTIFIITADHTCGSRFEEKYKNKIGKYAIPLLIFSGDSSLQGKEEAIVQQIDIMPTALELLGYNKPFFAFGKSMSSKKSWAISFLQNQYSFITDNGILINKEENYQVFEDWNLTKETEIQENDLQKLKAIKQHYNNAMIENKLLHED